MHAGTGQPDFSSHLYTLSPFTEIPDPSEKLFLAMPLRAHIKTRHLKTGQTGWVVHYFRFLLFPFNSHLEGFVNACRFLFLNRCSEPCLLWTLVIMTPIIMPFLFSGLGSLFYLNSQCLLHFAIAEGCMVRKVSWSIYHMFIANLNLCL